MSMTVEQMKAEIARLQALVKKEQVSFKIVDYVPKNAPEGTPAKKYVSVPSLNIPGERPARGFFFRVEAIDQAIEALQKAKALL